MVTVEPLNATWVVSVTSMVRVSLALLIKTVGADRCLFGTERPGVGTVKDPLTGKWLDETRYLIEAFDWLSDADKKLIFEDNAKKLFNLKVAETAAV